MRLSLCIALLLIMSPLVSRPALAAWPEGGLVVRGPANLLDMVSDGAQGVMMLWNEESWDGRDAKGEAVASGIYYYQLKAGTQIESKKMVLLK